MIHRRPAGRPARPGVSLREGLCTVCRHADSRRGRRSIDLLDARVSVGVNRVSSSPCYKCARVAGSLVKKGKKKKKRKNFERIPSPPLPERATFRDVSAALNDREKGNFRDKNG